MEIILLVVLAIGIYIYIYNSLIKAKMKVEEGWSGITIQLKRRHNLIPNLVEAVRSAMKHENDVVDKIVEARSKALEALAQDNHAEVNEAEAALSGALTNFMAYTEDNPEITANANVAQLQTQLEETEDQIAAARRLFNGNVQSYNTKVMSIPWKFIATMKGFKTETLYEVDAVEIQQISEVPKVNLTST